MVVTWIFRAGYIIPLAFLVACVGGLYKVFAKMPDTRYNNDRGWIAFGLIWEVILIAVVAVKLIAG